jgi:superfamily I DNA/RNA helicase
MSRLAAARASSRPKNPPGGAHKLTQADQISTAGAARSTTLPHTELAEIVLDESGYTEMWQHDKSPEAPGRLENLKELVRSMEEFETCRASSNTSRWSWMWRAPKARRWSPS